MAQISMDLQKRARKILLRKKFKRPSKIIIRNYYHFDDIPLKLYLTIANSGEVTLLCKKGKANVEYCIEVWESIMVKNAQATNGMKYNQYMTLQTAYLKLIAQYVQYKAEILQLTGYFIGTQDLKLKEVVIDWEVVESLRKAGFNLNTDNSLAYSNSLTAALRRVENYMNQANIRQTAIKQMNPEKEENGEELNYEQILATLNLALGFSADKDISLAAFNQYQKLIKDRNEKLQAPTRKR